MPAVKFLLSSAIGVLLFAGGGSAQTAPPTVHLQPYLSGLISPVLLTNAKDGTRRNFIVEQNGIIKVVQPGSTAPTDFLNISSKVVYAFSGELGLLGLAFHPQFAANGYFFVSYSRFPDSATVVARYKTTDSTNTLGDPASERIVLVIPQPFTNHKGGMIEFRRDNFADNLYIGTGDGGDGNDPQNNAQNVNSLLGKFLRITPDATGNNTLPAYTIPADNPYVNINGADEIYATGLRNPWRWSFDRGGTNQLWTGDVGQGASEEVDIITGGGNYGWRVYEGNNCTNLDPALCAPANYTPPILQYGHTSGRCSITGGYVYRGSRGNLPNGAYTYADFCTGEIWMWQNNQQFLLLDTTRNISGFGEDEDGELYVAGLGSGTNGTVEKIIRDDAPADFDGDAKTDFSVFRPSTGVWYILNSFDNSVRGQLFGQNGDVPAPEDYDGDNITDIGVFRNGYWYYIRSSDNAFRGVQWGQAGDVPVASDYDGDGKADIAVYRYRTLNSAYYILRSSDGQFSSTTFSGAGGIAVPSDYDGDGKTDAAILNPGSSGLWRISNSGSDTISSVRFGIFTGNPVESDVATQGDYDGDGKADIAVYRPSSGIWYILHSSDSSMYSVRFGTVQDLPEVGDYDGDGKSDIAVFRPSTGVWYFIRSSNVTFGGVLFGQNGDYPVPYYAHGS